MTSAIVQPSARDIELLLYQLSQKRGWDLRLPVDAYYGSVYARLSLNKTGL